ncbi:hypothetical protein BRADI_1g34335v3 [Brachypodium distachyon]|uniref:Uncharacterized protein n=1 Tax=Brachypodium distachyon TaxID=15368 RepID=A0A2K2DMP4_BRADI|nr:hypothetical protein BRADI_1g34335v3 [Brachypodium distachyon]
MTPPSIMGRWGPECWPTTVRHVETSLLLFYDPAGSCGDHSVSCPCEADERPTGGGRKMQWRHA